VLPMRDADGWQAMRDADGWQAMRDADGWRAMRDADGWRAKNEGRSGQEARCSFEASLPAFSISQLSSSCVFTLRL